MSKDPWETLDREGILPPVAYSLTGEWRHEVPARIEAGHLLVREEHGHRPWAELVGHAEDFDGPRLTVLYHHWQLFALAAVQESLRLPLIPGNLNEGLEAYYEARARLAAPPHDISAAVDGLSRYTRDLRAVELLLVRVQNFFMPLERDGRYKAGPTLGLTEDDWTIEGRESFDYKAAAEDCGVSADDLRQKYEALAFEANRIDPTKRLFWLLDQVKRTQKERLEGSALRALDYYDGARVLRRWYRELTREWPPDVDELIGGGAAQAKERFFGKESSLRYDRSVLPPLLDFFGLYPWRVELIGEGESEVTALREIFDYGYGLSFERLGIHATPMRTANVPANAEHLLASMREYANYYLLVFDNEGRARELIDELLRRGVIEGLSDAQRGEKLKKALEAVREQPFASDAERSRALREAAQRAQDEVSPGEAPEFNLWREDLEADNFEISELVGVLSEEAERQDVEGFELTPGEVGEALEEERGRGAGRAVSSVLVDLAENREPPLRLGKPDYIRLLARFAVENPEMGDGQQRPILELAQHLLLLTGADRVLRGQLR